MNPFKALRKARADYKLYIETFQVFKDERIRKYVEEQSERGNLLWKEPLIQIARRYKPGPSLESLVSEGFLEKDVLKIFRSNLDESDSNTIHPHLHQTEAIRISLKERKNLIVATGTGSGKSFCFTIPIVSECLKLKQEAIKGIKAIIIYPMNALANSQYQDFSKRLHGSGLSIAKYTGDTEQSPDEALKKYRST